ncbi:Yip1 family protein [Roseimarinus sediminis]|uniref:Yip1 family protein n=1 Tax=Roseimarinus sediminis TaxID=1610899 RepID=UPI003D1FAE10
MNKEPFLHKAEKLITGIFTESFILLTRPGEIWESRIKQNQNEKAIFMRFFFPGLLIVFLSVMVGDLLFESRYGFLFTDSLIKAVRKLLILLMSYFAAIMILYEVSRWYRIPVGFDTSKRIVVYSMLPVVLLTILTSIFPFFDLIGILGLYSFYLVYSALISIYEIKPLRNISYLSLLLGGMFMAFVLISFLLSKLTALIIY